MMHCRLVIGCNRNAIVEVKDLAGLWFAACREHADQFHTDRETLAAASDWELSW